MLRAMLLCLVAATSIGSSALAQERKPPVPPGRDPGGVAIGLVSTGIDYTLPSIVPRLARDGEGELIGWDMADNDRQPFDRTKGATPPQWGGDGTAVASFLLGGVVRLVPVRVDPADPGSLARAVAFMAQTPARLVLLPIADARPDALEGLRRAAVRYKSLSIILPAAEGDAIAEALKGLDNVITVRQGAAGVDATGFGGRAQRLSGAPLAVAAAGMAAARLLSREPQIDARTLKRRLMEAGGEVLWRIGE